MVRLFFKRIGLFLLFNLLLLGLCEWALSTHARELFVEDASLAESFRYFESASKDIDIIFLGNSVAYNGIDPDSIRISGYKAYNFAFNSEPIGTTYYKMKYYLDRGHLPRLKVAVVSMLYSSLIVEYPINTFYDYSKYHDYADIVKTNNFKTISNAFLNRVHLIRTHSFLINNLARKLLLRNKGQDLSNQLGGKLLPNGFFYGTAEFTQKDLERERPNVLVPELEKPHQDEMFYLKRLIELFREHQIKVVFLQIPAPVFLLAGQEELAKNKDYDLFGQKIQAVLKDNFPDVPTLNYYKLDMGWKLDFFRDRGHLNARGAEFLGQHLTNDLPPVLRMAK